MATTDKLTDSGIRRAKASDKTQRLFDGGGLYLEITPLGSKRWRLKYRFGGKEKLLSMGLYPETSLAKARERRTEAREQLAAGVDPSAARKAGKALLVDDAPADGFERIAREFHETKSDAWSKAHADRWLGRMKKDVFPYLGKRRLPEITSAELLSVLRRVEARGVRETTHSIHQACGQVFRYGIATDRCPTNPAYGLSEALKPVLVKNFAAIVEPARAGDLMRAIHGYQGQPLTRVAMQLSALLFQRPGNVRTMQWAELDLDGALWTIPSEKMKRTRQEKLNGRPHLVPLARQAVAILREVGPLSGHTQYVFPSILGSVRPMSENTINTALRRLGFDKTQATAHGFRAMARTIMVEKLGVDPDVIEAQLAHGKSGPLGTSYDRAQYVEQRHQMMQAWADYLDKLRDGAEIIPFKARLVREVVERAESLNHGRSSLCRMLCNGLGAGLDVYISPIVAIG